MASIKSSPERRQAQEPQRINGKLRVAAILKAATAVIAEKGYEAATMADIAARSDTRIGSLYRFFPNKESLADAMMVRYRENIGIAFDKIDETIAALSIPALAQALFAAVLELREEGAAMMKLIEAGDGWPVKRQEFRKAALKRIARSLILYSPRLAAGLADDIAIVLLQNMKAMKNLSSTEDKTAGPGAIRELRHMTELYLRDRLQRLDAA